ncbi:HEPN domain-containing protein [Vulcanococcus limneticus Candia 3F8]|uniref:HEPN domain-containing protein n=1 Tax=Vulcanococcus limneticus TaxID=2170428 RepID=UPI000B986818|nr:HEPN domain-containing protein [Vulcanococcus limneticus]MCP9793359.1 HEPN domain-containing protein [Vulcanococcus limneticus MW73D5]MCP9895367.1 HEPN domain-containing protein [Vulcanococcus limneticus Candia 3F8]MCP9898849.1 HEPN domain-containing protein [Vulcanococcus limneticus Candia 3B3]
MALSEAEGLLRIAAADLETAIASSNPLVFREGAWGFWLQQAVEKALKAWLLHLHEDEPPLTHDLRRLLRLLAVHGAEIHAWQDLGVLTVYAVQFRYDADPTPLGLDRTAFNQRVQHLVLHVELLLQKRPGGA